MTGPIPEQLNGRPVIGFGNEILGGVMLSHTALVVDVVEHPETFEELYDKVLGRLDDDSPLAIGQTITQVIQEEVPTAPDVVIGVLKDAAREVGKRRVGIMDEIGLSEYLERHGGTCHHQSLTAAVMLRLLQKRRGVDGTVDIDRFSFEPGSHAWGRWTRDESVIIVDPAFDYATDLKRDPSSPSRKYRRNLLGRYVRPLRHIEQFAG